MNITIISPYLDVTSLSTRTISALLKREGHTVRQVFLPDLAAMIEHGVDFAALYPDRVVDRVVELCGDSNLVGVSLMTNYFLKARQLTRAIRKRIGATVVWGGVHPTVAPEECAQEADFVCVGEGEGTIVDLAAGLDRGEPVDGMPNLCTLRDGRFRRNPPRPLLQDLDTLPFPDYEFGDQFALVGREVVPLDEPLLMELSRGRVNFTGPEDLIYETMWSRGCPYHCTFCINNALIGLYPGQKMVRRRSVDHLIAELVAMRERFPWFNRINFADDCFIYAGDEEMRQFHRRYKEEIGFPFFSLLSVQSVSEEKLTLLADAGLRRVEVGIQSVSRATNALYRRQYFSVEKLERCSTMLRRHLPQDVVPTYDVILENPYENTRSVLETLRATQRLQRPFVLQLFSLTFFPGTELFHKALSEGTIRGSQDAYLKEDHHRGLSYTNFLFILVNRGAPEWIVRALSWTPLALVLDSPPARRLFSLGNRPYWALKRRRIRRDNIRRFGPLIERYAGNGGAPAGGHPTESTGAVP